MSTTAYNTSKIIITVAALTLITACSNSNFSGGSNGGHNTGNTTQGTNPPSGTTPPGGNTNPGGTTPPVVVNPPPNQCVPAGPTTRLTKIMFLVDTSGSNYGLLGLGGTDPHKKFRLGSIQAFFNRYASKTNFEWGFMTFSGRQATDFIGHDGIDSFTSNPASMQQALNHFSKVQDWGTTPYKAAMDHVITAVDKDKDIRSGSNPQYFVILLSDGFPTDIDEPVEIKDKITQLLAADPGNVTLSTVFYGHKHEWDANEAITLLTDMAEYGHGQFANAQDPKSIINIDDLIPHPNPCPQ